MREFTLLPLMLMVACLAGNAWAGSADLERLACGNKAIEIGMSSTEIQTNCGTSWQPSFTVKTTRPGLHADKDGQVPDDHFEKRMYKAAGKSDTHVLLKNGEVIRIFTTSPN